MTLIWSQPADSEQEKEWEIGDRWLKHYSQPWGYLKGEKSKSVQEIEYSDLYLYPQASFDHIHLASDGALNKPLQENIAIHNTHGPELPV